MAEGSGGFETQAKFDRAPLGSGSGSRKGPASQHSLEPVSASPHAKRPVGAGSASANASVNVGPTKASVGATAGAKAQPASGGANGGAPQPRPHAAPAAAAGEAKHPAGGMSGFASLGNFKSLYKNMNTTNIFHAMNTLTGPEERVKDLSQYRDRKPVVYGSLVLLAYISIGVLTYTQAFDWTFVDALYFIIVTLTTVGYGDLPIESDSEKLVTIFFVFIGVGLIGAALGIVAGVVMDKADSMEQVFDGRIGQMGANLIVSLILIVVMLGIGAGAFLALVEDDNGDPYSFLDAVYFASVTVTTVGYGDFSWNSSDGAKIFGVFYLITGTVVIAKALSDIASIPLERRRRQLEKMVLAQYGEGLSLEELREITESSGNGFCTKSEFVLLMLRKLDKVKAKDVAAAVRQFDKLDVDGSGILTQEDVVSQMKISEARNNAAAAVVVTDAFDDALEPGKSKKRASQAKSNQVAPV